MSFGACGQNRTDNRWLYLRTAIFLLFRRVYLDNLPIQKDVFVHQHPVVVAVTVPIINGKIAVLFAAVFK